MATILQINTSLNVGATGRIAEQIGEKIISEGWESYIAYGRYFKTSKSNAIAIGGKISIYLHYTISRLFDAHGLGSLWSTYLFIKKIKKINPDIVHLQNLHGYYINYPLLFRYLSKTNIPVVWTMHDCWHFTGHCSHFQLVNCKKWESQCYSCPSIKDYPTSLIDRSRQNYKLKKKLFTSIDNITIVPVSNWLGNMASKSFLSNYPINVIHNGIDLQAFQPKKNGCEKVKNKYGIKGDFIVIGVASVWTEKKGLLDFYSLRQLLPSNISIVLIGLNEQQIKDLPSGINGILRTESVEELAELYSSADIFFNPTYEDTFPTTILESLACGTPAATYDTGGCKETVDEETGFILERGDFNSMVSIIETVKNRGKDYYQAKCRERALKNYDNRLTYDQYITLYKKILSSGGKS